jgi:hypothetical protein
MAEKNDNPPKPSQPASGGSTSAQIVGDGNTVIQQHTHPGGTVAGLSMPRQGVVGGEFTQFCEVAGVFANPGETIQPHGPVVIVQKEGQLESAHSHVAGVVEDLPRRRGPRRVGGTPQRDRARTAGEVMAENNDKVPERVQQQTRATGGGDAAQSGGQDNITAVRCPRCRLNGRLIAKGIRLVFF